MAVIGASVVRFNDIEDGFNVSDFCRRGIIDSYLYNQSTFAEFLGTMQ